MSYEGYVQLICRNGHAYREDAMVVMHTMTGPEDVPCPTCATLPVWCNDVDETNGSFDIDSDGNETELRIDGYVELELDRPAETCTCATCKHVHEAKPATYKVPEEKGRRIDQTKLDGAG